MSKIEQLDSGVSFEAQLNSDIIGPVEFVEIITVSGEGLDGFEASWSEIAGVMKRQPGFISAQLRRGIAGSSTYMNIATWESLEHFRAALANPEFKEKIAKAPSGSVERPQIYRRVTVPGICIS